MTERQHPRLEHLLRRPDLWRGSTTAFRQEYAIDSGYPKLNQALQHSGWPSACLIEVCQRYHASEWWLFHAAINALTKGSRSSYIVLINPPATPFPSGLQQRGIDIRRIIIVQTKTPQEFVHSFTEVSQSPACPVVFAWQPTRALSYTQLRKLQLSTLNQRGLRVIFRHLYAREQSSPASLRLTLQTKSDILQVNIFKQKGQLRQSEIALPIPNSWKPLPFHRDLFGLPQNASPKIVKTTGHSSIVPLPTITSRSLRKGR